MLPDPRHDELVAVCYAVHDDAVHFSGDSAGRGSYKAAHRGVIVKAVPSWGPNVTKQRVMECLALGSNYWHSSNIQLH